MENQSIWKFSKADDDLHGCTVIIPSVAVGNVGQLSCDLLISSLDTVKYGSVYHPALIPVAGYDPYDLQSDHISSSCELYKCPSKNVAIMQLRAPLVFKYAQVFLEELVNFFTKQKVKDIIILTSSFAHEKKHIQTSAFRYIANEFSCYIDKIKKANWLAHETEGSSLRIYGGGFASMLFNICKRKQMPCLIIFKYCSEGDNIPDAHSVISHLVQVLPLFGDQIEDISKHLVQPVSWKHMFGRPPPEEIY